MSTISVRLPNSLHEAVRALVKKEGASINHFITLAVAEKLSALMTEEYLEARAERGDKAKFEKAMSKVADVEPDEHDRLYDVVHRQALQKSRADGMTLQELREQVRGLLVTSIRPESGEDRRRHLIEEAINNTDSENVFREFLYLHDSLTNIVPQNGFRTRFEGVAASTKGIGITYYDRPSHEGGLRVIGSVLLPTDGNHSDHLKYYLRGQQNPPRDFEPDTGRRGEQVFRYGFPVYRCIAIPSRQFSDFFLGLFQDSFARIGRS